MNGTATTEAARRHARAQAGGVAEAMVTLPASAWADPPAGVDSTQMTWAETVAGGGYTARALAAGTTVRLLDRHGDACPHVMLFNAEGAWERLNAADTVKVPWQAYLGAGHPLLSDQGRVLATMVGDTSEHHDALCGTSSRAANEVRYGDGAPEGPTPAGRELLLLAAVKHGLGPRDLGPTISFFRGIRVEADGALTPTGSAGPGAMVELRCELPLVLLLANVPHPLDPRPEYVCSTIEVLAWRGSPTSPEDPLWNAGPEAERAYLNTDDYARARGMR